MAGEAVKTNEQKNDEIVDDFAKAFTDLAKMADAPDSQLATKGAADPTEPTAEEKAIADKAAADAAAAAAPKPGDTPATEVVGDLPDPNTPEGKIAADEAAAAAAAGGNKEVAPKPAEPDRLDAAIEKLAERLAPKPAPQQRPAPAPVKLFTDDEVPVVQSYLQEFPDIAKAEEIIRRVEQRQLVAYMFSEFEKRVGPLAEMLDSLAGRTFKQDLTAAVPDYSPTIRQQVVEWVAKQPPYLQAAYNKVVDEGTVEEVADLVNRFKAETGTTTAPGAAKDKDSETELPTPAKKAVASLAPVGSKRTGTASAGIAKDDFEGAFKEAAAAET